MNSPDCVRHLLLTCCLSVGLLLPAALAQDRTAQDRIAPTSGADVFPGSTVAYVEIAQPAELVVRILEHPLRDDLEQLPFMREALDNAQIKQLQLGIAYLELRAGKKWPELVKQLTGKGAWLGIDEATGGATLLVRAQSADVLKETAGLVLGLATSDAESKGNQPPYQMDEYRGHKFAVFEGGVLARIDDWLLFSNNRGLAESIADNLVEQGDDTLARLHPGSVPGETGPGETGHDLWSFVDVKKLRERNVATELLGGKTDNPGVELLLGGILEALNRTSQATLSARLTDDELVVKAEMPFDATGTSPARSWFFGPGGSAVAPPLPEIDNTLAQITAWRDIAGWWNSKEELFDESVIAQMALADSQLSTFFGGLDFGNEILGRLQPGAQIIVKNQEYDGDYEPYTRLPSFALVGRLSDEKLERRLRIAFQSTIGIVNFQLAMQGQPQLETTAEDIQAGRIDSAKYVVDDEAQPGLILYNFSPTLAIKHDYVVLSSTRELATELVESAALSSPSYAAAQSRDASRRINSQLSVDGQQLYEILHQNREALIVQNMLEEGRHRQEAERNIEIVLAATRLLERMQVTLASEPESVNLELRVQFAPEK